MRHTSLHPAGYVQITEPEKRIVEADTLQCVHCGAHWTIQPGSGNVRGWCMRCNGPICGPKCAERCVPIEQQLENMEAGLPIHHRPVQVSVPSIIIARR